MSWFSIAIAALLVLTTVTWSTGDAVAQSTSEALPGAGAESSHEGPSSGTSLDGSDGGREVTAATNSILTSFVTWIDTCASNSSNGWVSGWVDLNASMVLFGDEIDFYTLDLDGNILDINYWVPTGQTTASTIRVYFDLAYPRNFNGKLIKQVVVGYKYFMYPSGSFWEYVTLTVPSNCLPAPTPTPTPSNGTAYVTKADGTNCRKTPNSGATVLKYLPAGTKVTTRGSSKNGWTPITCGGTTSYVMTSALGSSLPNLGTSYVIKSDGTNCRKTPSSSAGVLAFLPVGTQVTRRGASVNGWTPITCGSSIGYAMTSALGASMPNFGTSYVIKADGTNCRKTASTSAGVLLYLPVGTQVTRRGASVNGWTPITCGSSIGYAMTSALGSTRPSIATPGVSITAYINDTPNNGGTNCRTGPGFSAGALMLLPEGAKVTITGSDTNGWTPITCGGKSGFVSTKYLSLVNGASAATSTPTATPTSTAVPSPTSVPSETSTPSPTDDVTAEPTLVPTEPQEPTPVPTETQEATEVPTEIVAPTVPLEATEEALPPTVPSEP